MKTGGCILTLFIGLGLLAPSTKAQLARIDPIQKVGSTQKQDTNRASSLLALSRSFYESNKPDQALLFANKALTIAQRIKSEKWIAKALVQNGSIYFFNKQTYETNLKAQENFVRALKATEKTGTRNDLAFLYYFIGTTYYRQGNHPQALTYTYKGLKLFQKAGNRQQEALALQGITAIFISQEDFNEALKNALAAIQIRRAIKDIPGVAQSLNTLAAIYRTQGKYAQALQSSLAALKLTKEPNFRGPTWSQPFTYSTLGEIYESKGDSAYWAGDQPLAMTNYKLALTSFSTSRASFKKLNQPFGIVETRLVAGNLYRKLNQFVLAEQFLNHGLQGAFALKHTDYLMRGYHFLSQLDSAKGNYGQAYQHYKTYIRYRDSLYNQQKTQQLTEVKMQYAFEKKEAIAKVEQEKKETLIDLLQQKAQLNQTRAEQAQFRNYVQLAVGMLLLLLGFAVSAWLLNRARLYRLQQAQQLRTQIAQDLHDEVGSTLSSISLLSSHIGTLLDQNKGESAQKMVQKIYTDARQILDSMDEIIWAINPSNDSLYRIALRLQAYAQPLMESKDILLSCQLDPTVEKSPVSIEARRNIYLIGKEAINNLVKYSQATKATIRFVKQDNELLIWIEDNGHGFNLHQFSQRTGQVSMKQRAKALGGRLTIQSTPGQGTTLKLRVKTA